MREIPLVVLVALGLMCGCTRQEASPPTPSPVPEPAKDTMAAELRQCLAPLTSLTVPVPNVVGWGENGQGAPAFITEDIRTQVLSCLQNAKAKYGQSDDANAAIAEVCGDLGRFFQEASDQERWRVVVCATECYEILSPGSMKAARWRERAQVRANRPDVHVKGFLEDKDKNEVYAFLHVTLHPSGEVKQLQVRKGEEFCGLRLVDFIGKLKGVLLEYLDIPGETFRAMGP